MLFQPRKTISTTKPVKAWKVLTVIEDIWFTGPWCLEQLHTDEWRTGDTCVDMLVEPYTQITGFPSTPGYHTFKSYTQGVKGLEFMAKSGRLGYKGTPHYVVPVYLRGCVEFGTYYHGQFKGVKGDEMLVKSKHLPLSVHEVRRLVT